MISAQQVSLTAELNQRHESAGTAHASLTGVNRALLGDHRHTRARTAKEYLRKWEVIRTMCLDGASSRWLVWLRFTHGMIRFL